MPNIGKPIFIGIAGLSTLPIVVWISNWTWSPEGYSPFMEGLYWITETSSYPWAALSSLFLSILFVWLLKLNKKQSVILISIFACAILGGQLLKSAIKETVEEPRPFVLWLEKEYKIDDEDFYRLAREDRARLVKQQLIDEKQIPGWLSYHWQNETGYSFPSGHTLFSCTWALLGALFLWPSKFKITTIGLFAWAILVEGSRLRLGMHWPQDLLVSIMISGAITWLVGYVVCNRRIVVPEIKVN